MKEECSNIKENSKSNRILYFDILNIFACINVVLIHMNGIVHSYSPYSSWKTALIFEVICYWAVPIFVMLSGATLLKYRERYNTKTFFKKRFVKVLIPWIIWSLITYVFHNKNINLIQFGNDFLYQKIENTYWFFPLILYLYCLIPVLSIFTEKKEYRGILKGIVIFLFIFKSVLTPIYSVMHKSIPSIFNYCLEANGYIMFLILGYLLSTTDISKKKRIVIYFLGIISALIRYFYTYHFSMKQGTLNRDLFNYTSALNVFMALSVFLFIKNINWEKIIDKLHIKPKYIATISGCSFGVYLIHVLVKTILNKLFSLNPLSIIYRTIGAICLYIICVIIVMIIKKIPIVKNIVP